MGFKSFIFSIKKILRISRKPGKSRFTTTLKTASLSLAIIGSLGFAIQLIATVFNMIPLPSIPKIWGIYALIVIIVIVLAVLAYGRKTGWW